MGRLSLWVYQLSTKAVALMLLVMTLLIIVQVLCRTFLGFSIIWVEELSRYLLIWFTFIGASVALRKGDLVAMDLIQEKIKGHWQRVYQFGIQLIVLCFVIIAFYYGIKQILTPTIINSISPTLRLPMAVIYAGVPVGLGLMIIHILDISIGIVMNPKKGKEEGQEI